MGITQVKVPLNAVLSYHIHSPHVRVGQDKKNKNKDYGLNDNFPLYARTDKVGYEGRSAEWLTAIEKDYNSPRNIRALYITKDRIIIKYWHSGNSFELTKEKSLDSTPKDVSKLDSTELTVSRLIQLTVHGMLTGQTPNTEAVLTGNGFKALKDWSLSNLEELYFDETMLIGCQPAVLKVLCGLNAITVKHDTTEWAQANYGAEGLYRPYNFMEVSQMERTNPESQCIGLLMGLLYTALGAAKNIDSGTLEFRDFPRLKFIGFIPGATGNGLSVRNMTARDAYIPEYNIVGSVDSLVKTALTREQFLKTGIYVNTGVNLYRAPFSTNKVWLFDTNYLQGTFDKFKSWAINNEFTQNSTNKRETTAVKSEEVEQPKEATVTPVVEKPKVVEKMPIETEAEYLAQNPLSRFEKLLNLTYKKLGQAGVRTSLESVVALRGAEEAYKEIGGFSEKGKAYYGKMLDEITKKG